VRSTRLIGLTLALGLALTLAVPALAQETGGLRRPDVIYVPTPPEVVDAMLKVAKVTSKDTVYDLGCGDGRIVITAVKMLGARGIGIDIDPERIKEAEANAQTQGVAGKVTFKLEDLFEANISDATVVTLYLLPSLNLKLRPKLWKELKVGTRIVSHAFDMGDWEPEQHLEVDGRNVYFWTITEDVKKKAATGGQ
jgi:ribosomal protein L11 methylase PrmA